MDNMWIILFSKLLGHIVRAGISLIHLPEEVALCTLSGEFLLLGVLQDEITVNLKGAFVRPLV